MAANRDVLQLKAAMHSFGFNDLYKRFAEENIDTNLIQSLTDEDLMKLGVETGRGVRTTINRTKGDFLMIYPGELITEREGEEREERHPSVFRYFFQYKRKGWWIKKRWSKEEESALREAFHIQIKQKKNVSTVEIRKAQKCYPVLQGRSEAVIRTKINNIK